MSSFILFEEVIEKKNIWFYKIRFKSIFILVKNTLRPNPIQLINFCTIDLSMHSLISFSLIKDLAKITLDGKESFIRQAYEYWRVNKPNYESVLLWIAWFCEINLVLLLNLLNFAWNCLISYILFLTQLEKT